VRLIEIKKIVMSEMFIESDQLITVAHEDDMLLDVIFMVSVKEQVRIGNKKLQTIKASAKGASNKSKSGTSINEICLQSKVEQYCNRIYIRVNALWIA
jgi:hypothetical protein